MPLAHEWAVTFGRLAANHLWQSTGFAAVAVVLALALRANSARARYWLWLAASVKFLIPFFVLAAMGGGLGRWLVPATPVARVPLAIEEIVQPFAPLQGAGLPAAVAVPVPAASGVLPVVLLAIWLCGLAAVLLCWWVRWRRVAAAVRSSTPLREGREVEALWRLQSSAYARAATFNPEGVTDSSPRRKPWETGGTCEAPAGAKDGCSSAPAGAEVMSARPMAYAMGYFLTPLRGWLKRLAGMWPAIRLVSSTARLEPGIFGIFRPVLWLPAGIGDRLGDAELEAILAHELCHARRRDNLAAVIHMAVEAVFWFHPLVWWLGARLTEERERACDEEVVQMGGEPQVYAESILKVCEFYLASPVACAAGVTGGELKKRIEGIMANGKMRNLSAGKKFLVAVAGLITLSAPVALGVMGSPVGRARARVESHALAPSEGPVLVAAREAVVPAPVQAGPGAQKAPAGQTARALLLTSAVAGSAQTRKAPQAAPVFEVVSFKHAGNARDGERMEGNIVLERAATRLGYNGVKLTGEEPLLFFIKFAYSPLLTPFQCEAPQWVTYNEEFYRIDAIAPAGTSIDGARAMLRTVLVERLGFQYHLVDRDTPIYALTRGSGELRLPRSTEAEPNPGYQQWGIFRNKSASLAQLAEFVSRIAGRPVVDRTGIQGLYRFDVDWSKQIENERQSGGSDPRNGGPGIAFAEVKQLGLKLEPGKELRKVLVVDHVNKEPTPN